MPLYEYQCENCGDVFELIQKFSAEPLAIHEKCGGTVHRLISAPALQFKGSGWYVNDYAKSGSGANGGKKDGDSGSASGNKEGGSSAESKDSKSSDKSSDSSKTSSTSTPATSTPAATSDKK